MEFCKTVMVDIAGAWQAADIDQKQRVQQALFENGLNYHPQNGMLNTDKDCLFATLEGVVASELSLARPERFELPT